MTPYELKHLHKMKPNWLFPYLVTLDQLPDVGTGRWAYWSNILLDMKLPDKPIPTVLFREPHPETIKHVTKVLELAEVTGVRHSDAFEALVVWILHGLGLPEFRQYETADQVPDLRPIKPKVLDQWYETFNLGLLLKHPADYMAFFAQGGANKNYNPYSRAGFFATPMPLCRMMVEMTFASSEGDTRRLTVNDPCCGTGSLLLAASNYSMRLYAQDISPTMVNCVWVNAYLYMPWMVFHPDFSVFGGPTWAQLEERIFKPEPEEQPILVQLPLFPVALPEPVVAKQAQVAVETLSKTLALVGSVEAPSKRDRRVVDDALVRERIRERLERRAGLAA